MLKSHSVISGTPNTDLPHPVFIVFLLNIKYGGVTIANMLEFTATMYETIQPKVNFYIEINIHQNFLIMIDEVTPSECVNISRYLETNLLIK